MTIKINNKTVNGTTLLKHAKKSLNNKVIKSSVFVCEMNGQPVLRNVNANGFEYEISFEDKNEIAHGMFLRYEF